MSKIALTPNASGSGTFTIASPNSNTDRTLTLPDSAGTIATTNGITMTQQWRLTSDLTGNANPISSNLEIVDTDWFRELLVQGNVRVKWNIYIPIDRHLFNYSKFSTTGH
jgi:hypothetical protein